MNVRILMQIHCVRNSLYCKLDGAPKRVHDGAPVLDYLKDRPGKRSRCLSLGIPSSLRIVIK